MIGYSNSRLMDGPSKISVSNVTNKKVGTSDIWALLGDKNICQVNCRLIFV